MYPSPSHVDFHPRQQPMRRNVRVLAILAILIGGSGAAIATNRAAAPPATSQTGLESRIQVLEDKEEILELIAAMPFSSDVPSTAFQEKAYTSDAVMDVGLADKDLHGQQAVVDTIRVPNHLAAVESGMSHFSGLPYVRVHGNRAVATGYLEILAPNPTGPKVALGNYPPASGLIIWRVTVNRWELARIKGSWRITKRFIQAAPSAQTRSMLHRAIDIDN